MEMMHRKHAKQSLAAQTACEFIVKLWMHRSRPPVDAQFLEIVQSELAERLANNTMSPASIARLLADEGAELRHPEIIEFDVRWRESLVKVQMDKFAAVERL